jgi:hypothetical protein
VLSGPIRDRAIDLYDELDASNAFLAPDERAEAMNTAMNAGEVPEGIAVSAFATLSPTTAMGAPTRLQWRE